MSATDVKLESELLTQGKEPTVSTNSIVTRADDFWESHLADLRVEDFEVTILRYLRIRSSLIAAEFQLDLITSSGEIIWRERIQRGIFFEIVHAFKPWASYAYKLSWELALTLVAAPLLIFTSPIDFAALFVALPICCFVFFFLNLAWQLVATRAIGFKIAAWLSGLIYKDDLFEGQEAIKLSARRSLGRVYESPSASKVGINAPSERQNGEESPINSQSRLPCFSPIVSEFLLLVSAATYARDLYKLKQAMDTYRAYVARDNLPLPSHSILPELESQPSVFSEGSKLRSYIASKLKDSQAPLERYAAKLGLECSVVSELNSTALGPCCALYWAKADPEKGVDPFLVCAFNGTAPSAIDEWMLDASFQKIDARAYLHSGKAHAGFLTTLFPDDSGKTRGDDPILSLASSPYGRIVLAIRRLAAKLSVNGQPVPLWVTGHSLGAAIASTLYARFTHHTDDLGPHVVLRDAYCFGTPTTGDADFAAGYQSAVAKPFDNPNTLWRIINDQDLICRVPFSFQTVRDGGVGKINLPLKVFKGDTLLNYTPIGHGVRVFSNGRRPDGFSPLADPLRVMYRDVDALAPLEHRVVSAVHPDQANRGLRGPFVRLLGAIFKPLIKPMLDHSPIQYAASQRASRAAFDKLARADVNSIIATDIPLVC